MFATAAVAAGRQHAGQRSLGAARSRQEEVQAARDRSAQEGRDWMGKGEQGHYPADLEAPADTAGVDLAGTAESAPDAQGDRM